MPTTFMRGNEHITNDFLHGQGAEAVWVPFQNLFHYSTEELAEFGITKTVTADVPAAITRRQCARAMLGRALISGPEALAMTKSGDPPAMVQTLIDSLPSEQQTVALIDFAADTYLRSNVLLVALMTATGANSADIDAFFIEAGAL
jgi:hypothetical protein